MPIEQIIAILIQERDRLNRAIEALGGPVGKRRGRPPKNHFAAVPPATAEPTTHAVPPKARKKRIFSAAEREAARKRMKAYWAKRRKANA